MTRMTSSRATMRSARAAAGTRWSGQTQQGLRPQVLVDREWVQLSPHIRVMCVSDYNQDALLLIDINGRLLVNFNDGSALGSERFVKKVIRGFKRSFLLRLFSYGDA